MTKAMSHAILPVLPTLRDALRGLRGTPGASAAIVVILALGLGANATMFDIVDRLLLRPPDHVVEADRLRLVYAQRPTLTQARFARNLTYPDIRDLRGLPALAAVSAFTQPREMTFDTGPSARRVQVQLADASYFGTLGVRPVAGRFYAAAEAGPGAAPTAVVSEAFWRDALGADPRVLGRVLAIGRGRYQVVGIAPATFTGADLRDVDVWLPLEAAMVLETRPQSLETRTWWWASAVVRLAPGVDDATANAQMTAAHVAARRAVERAGGEPYLAKGPAWLYGVSIVTGRRPNPTRTAQVANWLSGVSAVVLLIACANVANLLLARSVPRARELAVRAALGAGRGRLLALMLIEASLLASAGTALALLVSRWTRAAARAFLPDVAFGPPVLDLRLFGFCAAAATATVLLAGLLPAVQASRRAATDGLRAGSRGSTAARSRVRSALVVAQTALSVVLLIAAGLFVRSLQRAVAADVGFDHAHLAIVTLEAQNGVAGRRRDAIYREALERVRALPGVRRAALAIEPTIAFGGWSGPGGIQVPGGELIDDLPDGGPFLYAGTAGFFETLGVPIVRGRSFVPADDVDGAEPVGMVSATFARTVWSGRDAIGQCFRMGAQDRDAPPQPCRRVVGVFGDLARSGLGDRGTIAVAVPSRPERKSPQALVVRTTGDPAEIVPRLRDAVLGVSGDVRFVDVEPMASRYADQLEPWTLGATLCVVFGGLALLVAAIGLYAQLAFAAAQRRREFGIRTAIGAGRPDLVWLVVRPAAALAATGLAAGTAVAWVGGRFVESLLFDVGPTDPAVYGGVAIVLGLAALAASIGPAWQAATVSPTIALRSE
jgi:putative ABC transport system permease protein